MNKFSVKLSPTPFFSVLTPTWNRSRQLHQVYQSLIAQTFRDFEWIIADDGSIDDTYEIVKWMSKLAPIPICYVRSDVHVGKARIDNEGLARARGQLLMWCDSDDTLAPNALETLFSAWVNIPLERRAEYGGIKALAKTNEGDPLCASLIETTVQKAKWNQLAIALNIEGDLLHCTRTDLLKEFKFPEVDFVIPESMLWTALGDKHYLILKKFLLIKQYNSSHSISFTGVMRYSRGRAYALALVERNLSPLRVSFSRKFWSVVNFVRYSVHGDIPFSQARVLWQKNSSEIAFWSFGILGCLLAIKDRLQGKVEKTHREFEKNNTLARISVENFSSNTNSRDNLFLQNSDA
jgi:glycosyltransferase involved in cell wall biosynthesis